MRKPKPAVPKLKDETEDEQRPCVLTGSDAIDKALRGGIPQGTLALVEGPSGSGKSVLSEHLAYGALLGDFRVALYVDKGSPEETVAQMVSLGLEGTPEFLQSGKLRVFQLYALKRAKRPRSLLRALLADLRALADVDIIVLDSLTQPVLHVSDMEAMDFLTACKEMCERGATIIVTLHSSTFDEDLMYRLHRVFDAHIHLDVEGYTYGLQMKEMNMLKVEKVRNGEVTQKSTLFFEVDPTLGVSMNISIKVLPLYRIRT